MHYEGWMVNDKETSFGMGIRKIDKQPNYSHGLAQTKQQIG